MPVCIYVTASGRHSGSEYRNTITSDDIKSAPLSEKPELITGYVDDNAPFREELNRAKSNIDAELLNLSPSDQVIIGSDGWLFLTDSVKWHTPEKALSANDLALMKNNLVNLKNELAGHDTKLILFIAPDKASVYPEYLPNGVKADGKNTGKIISELRKAGITVCFCKDALLPYKDSYPLYARYDTHWNAIAAYLGTRELVSLLGSCNPPVEELAMFPREFEGNDLARLVSMEQALPAETDYDFAGYGLGRSMPNLLECDINGDNRHYHTDGAASLNVTVITDSFFTAMEPFFTIAFSDVLVKKMSCYNPGDIYSTGADAVVIEICERSLSTLCGFEF